MNVDVDLAGREGQEQCNDGVTIAGEHILIGGTQAADQQPVLHRAAVDEQILVIGNAAVEGRQACDAAEADLAADMIDADRVANELAIGERRHPLRTTLVGLDGQRAAAVMLDGEADLGSRHGKPADGIEASGIFGARRAQELLAGGYAGEQALHLDPGARRQGGRPFRRDHAIIDRAGPAFRTAHAALNREPGDAGDRWQRLAAKTERLDRLDRIIGKLGGGMAFEGQGHLGRAHAAAVVDHFKPANSPFEQADGYAGGACVNGVLDQLLESARRALDHLARGDAVDEMFGQAAY
jgi:hypothetical protein